MKKQPLILDSRRRQLRDMQNLANKQQEEAQREGRTGPKYARQEELAKPRRTA